MATGVVGVHCAYVCATKLLPHSLATSLQWGKKIISKRCWRYMKRQIKWNEALERVFKRKIFPLSEEHDNQNGNAKHSVSHCVCVSAYDPAWQHRVFVSTIPIQSEQFCIFNCWLLTIFPLYFAMILKTGERNENGFALNAQILFYIFCSLDQLPVGILFCNSFSFPFSA